MTEQRSLWEYRAEAAVADDAKDRDERDTSRRRKLKGLRASCNWLLLLRAAHAVPQPFTLNDISVVLWRNHPEIFGMNGYPYPDNHKVHYILYGSRGLVAQGLIRRVDEGLFRVPEDVDPALLNPPPPPPKPPRQRRKKTGPAPDQPGESS